MPESRGGKSSCSNGEAWSLQSSARSRVTCTGILSFHAEPGLSHFCLGHSTCTSLFQLGLMQRSLVAWIACQHARLHQHDCCTRQCIAATFSAASVVPACSKCLATLGDHGFTLKQVFHVGTCNTQCSLSMMQACAGCVGQGRARRDFP